VIEEGDDLVEKECPGGGSVGVIVTSPCGGRGTVRRLRS
jgi:hypothetical protein